VYCLTDREGKSECWFYPEYIQEDKEDGTSYVWRSPASVFNEMLKGKQGQGLYYQSFEDGSAEARIEILDGLSETSVQTIDYSWNVPTHSSTPIRYTILCQIHTCIDGIRRRSEPCTDCSNPIKSSCFYRRCGEFCRECQDTFDTKLTKEELDYIEQEEYREYLEEQYDERKEWEERYKYFQAMNSNNRSRRVQ
jgi:hypothetical protein